MVSVDIETIGFSDLKQFKIKDYKLDENIVYNTESVSYSKEGNEDNFIVFTMTPEFDTFGYEIGKKGVTVEFSERCSVVKIIHFSPAVSWNAIQAYLDRNFNGD